MANTRRKLIQNQLKIKNLKNAVGTINLLGYDSEGKIVNAGPVRFDTLLPAGLKGQIMKVSDDNSNTYITDDTITVGNYIETDQQLDDLKGEFITQEEIFNTWYRMSHGGTSSGWQLNNLIPSVPSQTNSWNYDPVTNLINSTQNASSHLGFISKEKYNRYRHKATLTSSGSDDDGIGLIIAFIKDENDLVPNNAFGLNPADFNWEINTVDEFIPNEHTLTLFRNRGGHSSENIPQYSIIYNFSKLDQKIIAFSNEPVQVSGYWSNREVDVEVIREDDVIKVRTTNFSEYIDGKGELRFELEIDLREDPDLHKFRGPASYGYSCKSQVNSMFKDIEFNGGINEIYDLRNGDVWVADNSGVYSVDVNRNMYDEILPRSLFFNSFHKLLGYTLDDNKYLILSEPNSGISNLIAGEGISITPVGERYEISSNQAYFISSFTYDGSTDIFELPFIPIDIEYVLINGVQLPLNLILWYPELNEEEGGKNIRIPSPNGEFLLEDQDKITVRFLYKEI